MEKAQAAADAAKVEYERVTERLLREAETFKYQKAQDIRAILLRFIDLQVQYMPNETISCTWLN